MSYFNQEFIAFFKGLAANNHKDWFQANKKTYENEVKKPFYRLVQDVIDGVKKHDSELDLEVKNAVFRINRDIRFSKDKTPYKLHVAGVVSREGRKGLSDPGIYFHLGIGETFIGGGMYQPSKEMIHKIRTAISNDIDGVKKILSDKKFKEIYGEVKGEKNKIIPQEFKEATARYDLIANKQFYAMANYNDNAEEIILRDDLADYILEHYRVIKPWNDFLVKACEVTEQ